MGGRGHGWGWGETLKVAGAEDSARAVVEVGVGLGCGGAGEPQKVQGREQHTTERAQNGRGGAWGGAGADSRTPARRLLGQLQPVDGEAVGAAAHAAALAFAPHVTLGLAHICCLDLVAAVALGTELQPGVQVTPGEGCGQAGAAATMQTPGLGDSKEVGGLWGSGPPRDHPRPSSPYTYPRGHTVSYGHPPYTLQHMAYLTTHTPQSLGSLCSNPFSCSISVEPH